MVYGASVRDINSPRSLRLTGGFCGWTIEWGQFNSTTTDPCWNWRQNRL